MSQLIYKKMSDVMKDIGFVGKDQRNQAQGFKFRGIDDMINAFYPALVKHGVFMAPRATSYTHELKEVTRSNGKAGVDKHVTLQVEYDFYAEDGSKVTVGPIPAEGLDSGDKATNKALSAGLKYALIQTFSVPTEDMSDSDAESPELQKKDAEVVKPEVKKVAASASKTTAEKLTIALVKDAPTPAAEEPKPVIDNRKKLREAYDFLSAQKKLNAETFRTEYLGGGKIADVSDNQINIAIVKLRLNFENLPL